MKTNIMLFLTVCPLFWRRFATDLGVYCFKLITEFMTWHDARDKCGEYGADLSSIRGDEEADFVKNQVQLCGYVSLQSIFGKIITCWMYIDYARGRL